MKEAAAVWAIFRCGKRIHRLHAPFFNAPIIRAGNFPGAATGDNHLRR